MFQAAEDQLVLEPTRDPRHGARDFASDKVFAASRRFMVVKDAVANKESVPNRGRRGRAEWRKPWRNHKGSTAGAEWFRFGAIPSHFRKSGTRGVVEFLPPCLVARDLQQPQGGHSNFIAGRFRDFEAQTDVALPGEMIDFRGLHFRKDAPQGGSIGKIAVMQEEAFVVDAFVAP